MKNIETVLLEDETLRDGIQTEKKILSVHEKLHIYKMLIRAGVKRVQVGSFVHPQLVPQMANTDDFIKAIGDECDDNCIISALVLNERGLNRALDSGLHHLTMSVSVSNTHSRKNVGKSPSAARTEVAELVRSATRAGITVRAGVQCAFGCCDDGIVDKKNLLDTVFLLSEAGAGEINLADTAGLANPRTITEIIGVMRNELPEIKLSLHLHDTQRFGLVNLYSGYMAGVRIFDVCVGGLGGCPAIDMPVGNVATENAVRLFDALGVETLIDHTSITSILPMLTQMK